MALLSKNQILKADDLKRETVPVPEWGGEVLVSALSASDYDAYENSLSVDGSPDLDNARARFAVRCMVDEQGNRVFEDADADLLGEKSAAALIRVTDVAMKLNRRTAKDLEELAKNSEAGPTGS